MIGDRTCAAGIRRGPKAAPDPKPSKQSRCHRRGACLPGSAGTGVAAALLLFVLTLQSLDLHAELLFRSATQVGGQRHWSALKKYSDASDTGYLRGEPDGTPAAPEEVQVFLQGYITSSDVYGAKVMDSLLKKGRQRIAGGTISFASSGGEVDAAMELGRILRTLGVTAVVAKGDQCLSSCVFAFMGGDRRTVAGQVGIHRPYFASTREVPDRRLHYRQLQKKLQEFIEELDFPPSLYEAVMAVPPQLVSILTVSDLKRFYLEGTSPSIEDEADAASARGLGITLVEYLQRKAAGSGAVAEASTPQRNGETASANPAVGAVGLEKTDP